QPPATLFPYTTLFRSDADVDPRAAPRPGVDRDHAADQVQPLPHAHQPEPAAAAGRRGVEPGPVVADPQPDPVRRSAQLDRGEVRSEEHTSELQSPYDL